MPFHRNELNSRVFGTSLRESCLIEWSMRFAHDPRLSCLTYSSCISKSLGIRVIIYSYSLWLLYCHCTVPVIFWVWLKSTFTKGHYEKVVLSCGPWDLHTVFECLVWRSCISKSWGIHVIIYSYSLWLLYCQCAMPVVFWVWLKCTFNKPNQNIAKQVSCAYFCTGHAYKNVQLAKIPVNNVSVGT